MGTRMKRMKRIFWWPCGHFFLIYTDLPAFGGAYIESIFYKASKNQHRFFVSFHGYAKRIHPPKAVLIHKNQKEVAARPPKNPFKSALSASSAFLSL
ncbi:MAG: hypothetical protein JNM22_16100 [Saprospiraceae bacterium]|nr:hypothetical protein [Saprospiraceae bacterium]